GRIDSSSAVADLDGDGTLEVQVGSYDDKLYCFNHTGGIEWSYTTGDDIYSSPCVADLDNDGIFEVIVGSLDYKLYCLGLTGVTSSGVSPWYCFRGSAFHTGHMDSDSDYMDDQTEVFYGTNPQNDDTDNDMLEDWDEINNYHTDPTDDDSDDDGLTDYEEVITYLSDSWVDDTDEDGLSDYDEAKTHFTDPTNYDSDGDGYSDYVEVIHGTDPLDPNDHPPTTITLPPETTTLNQTITVTAGIALGSVVLVVASSLTISVIVYRRRRK
ncbi:unnamed protein product, partial [marine sediment metagenome]